MNSLSRNVRHDTVTVEYQRNVLNYLWIVSHTNVRNDSVTVEYQRSCQLVLWNTNVAASLYLYVTTEIFTTTDNLRWISIELSMDRVMLKYSVLLPGENPPDAGRGANKFVSCGISNSRGLQNVSFETHTQASIFCTLAQTGCEVWAISCDGPDSDYISPDNEVNSRTSFDNSIPLLSGATDKLTNEFTSVSMALKRESILDSRSQKVRVTEKRSSPFPSSKLTVKLDDCLIIISEQDH
ncbi:hypothetical protein J6590_047861 [Homalodisca vitripennis]|nr:hypothetical protein J6590_047861 [Homalodisca vitripennis]